MRKPYYQDEWVTIYHGDCREILPELPKVDLVLTDPPYKTQHLEYGSADLTLLKELNCKQVIFWSARDDFPLDYTAVHIWDKANGSVQFSGYERIFERNGSGKYWRIYRATKIRNKIDAQMNRDIVTHHPSQKPQRVVTILVGDNSNIGDLILDPFLGSGTTAYCAKKLNRKCIGIEIEEKYCEIAVKRCSQQVFDFSTLKE